MEKNQPQKRMAAMSTILFGSRWLQLPLYLGLIVAQCVYVFHFMVELTHLVQKVPHLGEADIMLIVLGLIDVVMISNLLIMVIVGGYETFVSRLNLQGHPDEPDWLSHVNANLLKVKLATAIIGISSIHLLKSFINAHNLDDKVLIAQTVIHMAFVLSAISIAYIDKLMASPNVKH
ncbi:MAG TPA: TIGR00645 family protein [Methylophilaceae bacterium]|nr:TIGR00645 family protein [Methylophilaceae bacterium]